MGEVRGHRARRSAGRAGRATEFEAFVAGAGGRLLHAAVLLTGEPPGCAPAAERLLVAALARTYADWQRLRGDDPYAHARRELVARFARLRRRHRRARGGLLAELPPQERLVVVLRFFEGVGEEQAAAGLELPPERVRALGVRGMATALSGRTGGPRRPSSSAPAASAPSDSSPSSAAAGRRGASFGGAP